MSHQLVFGPVPSRRLGRSLGINNIPPKCCSYACVYCQLGNAAGMTFQRERFYEPSDLVKEVELRLSELGEEKAPDYLTIVPDGEPTLDLNLGILIDLLKPLGIKIAVISNGSTLYLPDIREELNRADWVSIKADAVLEPIWRNINRPFGRIQLESWLNGFQEFSTAYQGTLVSETMLVRGLNDHQASIQETARFLSSLKLKRSYLAVPIRPPAERWVRPPSLENINQAYQIFQEAGLKTELLIGYEGDEFSATGDLAADLLSITAVHPLREQAVDALLIKYPEGTAVLSRLLREGKLVQSEYQGKLYYLRRFQ